MTDRTTTRRELRWRFRQHLPVLIGLVVLWMLLWGEITLLSVLSGIVVAVAVTRIFYLPPVELSGRVNIGWLIVFVLRFTAALVMGSITVAWQALSPRTLRTNALVGVKLRTSSDFVLTMTATAVTLVPGSVVVEIDRDASTLYLHLLGVGDERGVERMREVVLRTESQIVRAVGSRDDLRKVAT